MFLYTVSCRAQLFVCPTAQKQIRLVNEARQQIYTSENLVLKRLNNDANVYFLHLNKQKEENFSVFYSKSSFFIL